MLYKPLRSAIKTKTEPLLINRPNFSDNVVANNHRMRLLFLVHYSEWLSGKCTMLPRLYLKFRASGYRKKVD